MLAPVAIALGLTLAAGAPSHRRFLQPNLKRGAAGPVLPLFEFLKTDPTLAEQCTGSALTGSKGETVTHTRAGTQVCEKADGTWVTLTADQPALEADGLRVAPAVTHYALRSEEFDHAAWNKGCGSATANAGTGPEGTSVMDRVTFSVLNGCYQVATTPSSTSFTMSVVRKQDASPKTMMFGGACIGGASIAVNSCSCEHSDGSTCVADSVTQANQCYTDFATTASNVRTTVRIGCASASTGPVILFRGGTIGGVGATSGSVLLGYFDVTVGLVRHPYAKVEGTAVATAATVTNLPDLTLGATPSMAMTVKRPGVTNGAYWGMTGISAADNLHLYTTNAAGNPGCQYGAGTSKAHSGTFAINTATRVACAYDGTNLIACNGGACETGAASVTLTSATTANALGYNRPGTTAHQSGWIKAVCIDSTAGGCR